MFGIRALKAHFDNRLDGIMHHLDRIERKVTLMANSIADLDAALANFETASQAADTADAAAEQAILSAVNDLVAKIGTTVDLAPEIDRINAALLARADASVALAKAAKQVTDLDIPPAAALKIGHPKK